MYTYGNLVLPVSLPVFYVLVIGIPVLIVFGIWLWWFLRRRNRRAKRGAALRAQREAKGDYAVNARTDVELGTPARDVPTTGPGYTEVRKWGKQDVRGPRDRENPGLPM